MIEKLFSDCLVSGQQICRFRVIRPVYEDLCVGEPAEGYQAIEAISAPATVHALFSFLKRETKEYLIALHLDSKKSSDLSGSCLHRQFKCQYCPSP